jgi:hypothetical protein
MSSFDNEINEIIKENLIFRFAIELEYTEDEERKNQLKIKLDKLQFTDKMDKEETQTKLDDMFSKIDEFTLKKPWSKLSTKQKNERIDHFIKTKKLSDSEILLIKSTIDKFIKNKKLKTSYIEYNIEMGQIDEINIPDLNI